MKLTILHLTDFHYTNDRREILNQIRLVDSLVKSLADNYKDKIDLLFFTGDLVNRGDDIQDFYNASDSLLNRLSSELNILKTNVFICPGNHDVYRNQELDDIKESISKIRNNDELDNYVLKQNGKSLDASLENLNNYFEFHNVFYEEHKEFGDELNKMYTVHQRLVKNSSMSIITINSAWRAIDSKTDSGNLLYPIHFLKNCSNKIKSSDLKVVLMHHPLSDFKYWNSQILENIIFQDFHIMFSGHTHLNRDTIHIVPETGIYSCTSPATLSVENDSKIGYSIVEIDMENFGLEISNHIYDKDSNNFFSIPTIKSQIPISEQKKRENHFRETIRKKFNQELEKADDLFLSYSDKKESNNFLDLFTDPIIDEHSQALIGKHNTPKNVTIDELIKCNENQILFGKDKSGKTAILYKILLETLNSYSTYKILPIYFNCKEYIKSERELDILKQLRLFYELNKTDTEKLSEKYHIKILLDNFTEDDKLIIAPLQQYISKYGNSSIIATGEETILNSFSNKTINITEFSHKFIWDIGRTQIRSLANKWPNLSQDDREILLEKIHKVFTQLNIPSNYWTVSLFIWIFEKNSDANFRNNFQLIELYIDNLLDKDGFVKRGSIYKIDFEDFKSYLSELAFFLVTEKSDKNYVLTYVELVAFTDSYKKRNRKFVIDIESIVELINSKGVLKKIDENNFTFRLNGVFEYFLAYYMKDNHDFRDEIIEDGHFYLSFGNEFEICAGFNSKDMEYVSKIYNKTQEIFYPINSVYDFTKIDKYLLVKIEGKLNIDLRLPDILKESLKPLSLQDQDVIFEEITTQNNKISEVQPKKYYEKIETNSDNLEKALFILARVFRNSKFKDLSFEDEIFDFILNSSCTLGFMLMDEIEKNKLDFINEDITEKELMRLLSQFIPVVIQTFFYDALVQNNLENIILQKIENLKKDYKNNQLQLLILYFSIIDLNVKQNIKYIDEIIELLSIGVLKQTSLIKLYLYLATKVNGNKVLEGKIQQAIKTQEIKIDSKKNIGQIEKGIASFEKANTNKKK